MDKLFSKINRYSKKLKFFSSHLLLLIWTGCQGNSLSRESQSIFSLALCPNSSQGAPRPAERYILLSRLWICLGVSSKIDMPEKTYPEMCPVDMLARCPNHLKWFIWWRSSESTAILRRKLILANYICDLGFQSLPTAFEHR